MGCKFDFFKVPYMGYLGALVIIIKSVKMIHIHIKHVHFEFHRSNKIFANIHT